MTKNILNHAFRKKTAISKLMNDSHDSVSKNLFYYENPQVDTKIFSGHKNDLKKWNECLKENESRGLQKELFLNFSSRNTKITASSTSEENILKFSKHNNLQSMSNSKKVLNSLLWTPQPKRWFRFLNKIEHKKPGNIKNHGDVYSNVKNWLFHKFLSKEITGKKEKINSSDEEIEKWGGPKVYASITFIKEDFDAIVGQYPAVLVFFSASWCQYCMNLRLPFGKAAMMAKEAKLPIKFATFDISSNPDVADEKGVIGVPVLKYYKYGKFVSDFKGKRTSEALFDFAKNPPGPHI